jgi:sugar/nucleoside kinase (ribokinase family)
LNPYNVFGVGNALVDIISSTGEDFLKANNIKKGIMTLVDTEAQSKLLGQINSKDTSLRSGGSAANTIIGLANCGGTGVYIGKVGGDTNGSFYKMDMEKFGIVFEVKPGSSATGTCVVLTTPDGDRTMLTNLGISSELTKADIDEDKLAQSDIAYVEGYLWDKDNTKEACLHTMETAKKLGKKVAFTYSDPFCVHRSKDDFIKLTKEFVDIAFCNHDEAMALTSTDSPEDAIHELGSLTDLAFMTWGAQGAYLCHQGLVKHIPGFVVKPIDSNGAGDAFAAGVLYGLTHDYSVEKACRWGNYMASRVILELGPRLSYSLKGKQEEVLEGLD